MIELSFNRLCLIYLSCTLISIAIIGITSSIRKKQKIRVVDALLLVCEFCQHAYIEDKDLEVTTCPQCQLLNKNNGYKKKKKPNLKSLLSSYYKKIKSK